MGSRTPSFAIDESGRPLIALVDVRRASLDLIDCVDAGCTDLESRSIATLAQGEDLWSSDALSLSLDAQGNPIIAVGERLAGDVKQDVAPTSQDAGYVKPENHAERWAGTVIAVRRRPLRTGVTSAGLTRLLFVRIDPNARGRSICVIST